MGGVKGKQFLTERKIQWWTQDFLETNHGINAHDLPITQLPSEYLAFFYPRAFTSVCTAEIYKVSKMQKEFPVPVLLVSTDTPEATEHFLFSKMYFNVTPSLKYLTVRPNELSPSISKKVFNPFGYPYRKTVYVKDNEVVWVIGDKDIIEQRNLKLILDRANATHSKTR